jgi:hypothetical protein
LTDPTLNKWLLKPKRDLYYFYFHAFKTAEGSVFESNLLKLNTFDKIMIFHMTKGKSQDDRFAEMKFASVYPLYLTKVARKGRTQAELNQVIQWLTGFSERELVMMVENNSTFALFFEKAKLHPNASKITGLICGYRIEEIENPLTQKVRYLDKLVDELAKGKPIEKIFR